MLMLEDELPNCHNQERVDEFAVRQDDTRGRQGALDGFLPRFWLGWIGLRLGWVGFSFENRCDWIGLDWVGSVSRQAFFC